MANIGLDATGISIYGKGVSRHQCSLNKSLSKYDKQNFYYIFLNRENILPELPSQDNFRYVRMYIPKRIIWDQVQVPWIIKRYKLDIYHSMNDTLPVFGKAGFVLSVAEIPDHRIESARRSKNNSLYAWLSQEYNKFLFCPSLRKAKVIIAHSHSTKRELMQKYGIEEKKIRVVYHAANECFYASGNEEYLLRIRKKYDAEAGYILHISSSDPRDNTQAVLRAYQKMQQELKTAKKLIICGGVNLQESGLKKLISELNLGNNIIFTGHLLQEDLVQLYQAADLYIDSSLYEGFGLQVVEAMACGIPVITSNLTSLPEVVGDAGILVSPDDIDVFASALVKVSHDPGLRRALCQKSLERAKVFSWDRAAQDILGIYNELILESDG